MNPADFENGLGGGGGVNPALRPQQRAAPEPWGEVHLGICPADKFRTERAEPRGAGAVRAAPDPWVGASLRPWSGIYLVSPHVVWAVWDIAIAPSRGEGWLGFPEIVRWTISPNHGRSPGRARPGLVARAGGGVGWVISPIMGRLGEGCGAPILRLLL